MGRRPAGTTECMKIRLMIVAIGVVALIVGVVGLLAPVSASKENQVECGSALAPDLSEARSYDDGNAANVPVPEVIDGVDTDGVAVDGVIVDRNFTRLCQMNLDDRRIWTITVAAAGALLAGGALVQGALSRRSTKTH